MPYEVVTDDCLNVLRSLPDNSVDFIFADPPYFLSNGGTTCVAGERQSVDKGAWDKSAGVVEDHKFHGRWLKECARVLKDTGTIAVTVSFHAKFSVGFAMQRLGFHVLNDITWHKTNPAPNLACRSFTHSHEDIIWASPRRLKGKLLHSFNYAAMKSDNGGKQMHDVWDGISTTPPGEKRHGSHPTQKPEALLSRIIRAMTNPGDYVVDPFAGSGTSGAMAVYHGRRYLGIEMDAKWKPVIEARCAEAEIRRDLALKTGVLADTAALPDVVNTDTETPTCINCGA